MLLGLLAVCIAVYALLVKREASSGARKALAATGIVLAVAFAFACGVSYMMTSRPVWNTVALPLAYLGTALATGAALYLVMCAALKVDEGDVKKAGVYAAAGGALSLVLTVAFGLVSGTAFGDQAALFWVAVVLCGSAARRFAACWSRVNPAARFRWAWWRWRAPGGLRRRSRGDVAGRHGSGELLRVRVVTGDPPSAVSRGARVRG